MPKVGKKHFPYTKAGVAAAMKAQRAAGGTRGERFRALQKESSLGRGVHPGFGGQYSKGEHAKWEEAKRRRTRPGAGLRPVRPPIGRGPKPEKTTKTKKSTSWESDR